MLELNYDLQYSAMPSPNRYAMLIRSIARSFKEAAKSLLEQLKRRTVFDTEVGVDGEQTANSVLEDYRKSLQNTFGNSRRIDDIVKIVKYWIMGE